MHIHPPALIRGRHREHALELRPPAPRDAPALLEAIHASLPALRRFMPWAHFENTVEQQYRRLVSVQRDFWGDGDKTFHVWAQDRLLGCFGLHERTLSARGMEIGYWVRSDVAGQGIGTFVTRALVVVAFTHFELERLQLLYNAANAGSARIAEKCGFQVEGRLRAFTDAPSAEDVERGAETERTTLVSALLRDELDGLSWYASARAAIEVFDWTGAPTRPS